MIDLKSLSDINILYVEDEIDIQESIYEMIKDIFGTITLSSNGIEALHLYHNENNFDLILTDINMPKMGGLELIQEIRKIDKTLPIVITTAHDDASFLQKSIDLNVNGYVLKPLDINKLIESISQAVEARMLRKELERLNSDLIFKLKEKTFELNSILNSQDNLVVVSDGHLVHTANKKFFDFIGIENVNEFNTNIKQICKLFSSEEGYYYFQSDDDLCCLSKVKQDNVDDLLVKIKNKNNKYFIFKLKITTYLFKDVKHFVLTLTDVTDLKKQADLLKYQASHDSLTKLINRSEFNHILKHEIHRHIRYSHNFVLVMFDIDFFKKINDTYGHDIGDEVLINLSKLVRNSLRETDVVARWGGEEFMIILTETTLDNGYKKIESLRKKIESTKLSEKIVDTNITCSFGMTEYKNETEEILIKNVDLALYEAKNSGRNIVIKK